MSVYALEICLYDRTQVVLTFDTNTDLQRYMNRKRVDIVVIDLSQKNAHKLINSGVRHWEFSFNESFGWSIDRASIS